MTVEGGDVGKLHAVVALNTFEDKIAKAPLLRNNLEVQMEMLKKCTREADFEVNMVKANHVRATSGR